MSQQKTEAAFVAVRGNWVALSKGVTIVGRNIDCQLRFDDPSVSRRHMRFMLVEDRLLAEDLGSTNGTLVNGELLQDTRDLCDGDVIGIGRHDMRVSLDSDREQFDEPTPSRTDWPCARKNRPTPSGGTISVEPMSAKPMSVQAMSEEALTPQPGPARDAGPGGLSMSTTQKIERRGFDRRRYQRVPVDIPVIYNSELLSFNAVARDLSRGGVFLATDLLDEINTECFLTLLPQGNQALAAYGVVRRVVQAQGGSQGSPPGMGIEFQKLNDGIQQVLGNLVGQHEERA